MTKRIYKSTFPVGIRMCCLVYDTTTARLECEWTPSKPGKDMLIDPVRMAQYRDGRDALLAEVARDTGRTIAVVES